MVLKYSQKDKYKLGKFVVTINNNQISINNKVSINIKTLKRIIIIKYAIQTLLKIIIILLILR